MSFLSIFNKKTLKAGELIEIDPNLAQKIICGKVITFWSSKGGTGKTSVALNTCAYLTKTTGKRIVLIDVDEFGDTALSAGYENSLMKMPRPEQLLRDINKIKSFEDLKEYLIVEPNSGFYILSSPANFTDKAPLTSADYDTLVNFLKQYFDIIGFDCGDKLFDDYTRFALLNADVLTVVADQGKPTLQNLVEVLKEFTNPSSGIGKNKMIMVINKYRDNVGMPIDKLEKWFAPLVSSVIPISAMDKEFLRTLNKGEVFILKTNSLDVKQQYSKLTTEILKKL